MNLRNILVKCIEFLGENKTVEAKDLAQSVMESHPQLGMGFLLYGNALMAENNTGEAVGFFKKAVERDPASGNAHMSLAVALRAEGKIREAFAEYIKAMEIDPKSDEIKIQTADFLLELGQLQEAENLYRAALPGGSPGALLGLLTLMEHQGRAQEAYDLIGQSKIDLGNSIHFLLVKAKIQYRLKENEAALETLGQINLDNLLLNQAVPIHFLMGDLYDAIGDYAAAFGSYRKANQLVGGTYNRDVCETEIQGIIDEYSRENIRALPVSGSESEKPVFIIGMPRSGTSLLEQILSCHPQVHGAGELDDINRMAREIKRNSQDEIKSSAEIYLAKLNSLSSDAKRVTDKMPHNFLHLGLICQLFPKARIIYCRRDPMDTGLSCYRRNFFASHNYATDLGATGHFIRNQLKLMEHWRKTLPVKILEVRYEDVVKDFKTKIGEVLAYLGLPWDDAVLEFHKSKRYAGTASHDQVRQPLFTSAIGCARKYGSHLDELRKALGELGKEKRTTEDTEEEYRGTQRRTGEGKNQED